MPHVISSRLYFPKMTKRCPQSHILTCNMTLTLRDLCVLSPCVLEAVTAPTDGVGKDTLWLWRMGHKRHCSSTCTQSPEPSHKKTDHSEAAMLWGSPGDQDSTGGMLWSALPVTESSQPRWVQAFIGSTHWVTTNLPVFPDEAPDTMGQGDKPFPPTVPYPNSWPRNLWAESNGCFMLLSFVTQQ